VKDRKTIKIGDNVETEFDILESNIEKFSLVSGDFNPIHLDENYAKNTYFKKRIAHGMYVASFISSVIAEKMPGRGSIYLGQNLKFLRPVFIGDLITVYIEFIDIVNHKNMKLVTNCFNQDSIKVIEGDALVLPPTNVTIKG